jgi:hypothetical protein
VVRLAEYVQKCTSTGGLRARVITTRCTGGLRARVITTRSFCLADGRSLRLFCFGLLQRVYVRSTVLVRFFLCVLIVLLALF